MVRGPMRFLILNADYPAFLRDFYAHEPGLAQRPYREQLERRMETLFGLADFYSFNLRALGHDAVDIFVNNEDLQRAWLVAHGTAVRRAGRVRVATDALARKAWRMLPRARMRFARRLVERADRTLNPNTGWFQRVLEQQIEHLQPDVILNQAIGHIDADLLGAMRRHYGRLVGQIASPIPLGQDFRAYDLMLSSLPNLVEHFRRTGVNAQIHRLGFDPRVLERLAPGADSIRCSFVGQISQEHICRLHLLEQLCEETPLDVWAPGVDLLARASPIHARYRGTAWGVEMYRILARSRITVNNHLDLAGSHANNLRMYEATGVGTMLLTDAKSDLAELFVPGQEVVAYHDAAECAALISYYLDHADERDEIARGGGSEGRWRSTTTAVGWQSSSKSWNDVGSPPALIWAQPSPVAREEGFAHR